MAGGVIMSRLKHILIALDQFFNALCNGWPDETLSSRAWRWEQNGKLCWPRKAIDGLFFFDPDHSRKVTKASAWGGSCRRNCGRQEFEPNTPRFSGACSLFFSGK